MISLYTPVPQIATKSSDTERKNNRKSVRVIIYTVVKINSRPIGIGERKVSSSMHTQKEKCTPVQTYSYKEPKCGPLHHNRTYWTPRLRIRHQQQSLFSKIAVDRQPFTLFSSVPQTDTTNSLTERIVKNCDSTVSDELWPLGIAVRSKKTPPTLSTASWNSDVNYFKPYYNPSPHGPFTLVDGTAVLTELLDSSGRK